MMATGYCIVDEGNWSESSTWNTQADGKGDPMTIGSGDTAELQGNDVTLDASPITCVTIQNTGGGKLLVPNAATRVINAAISALGGLLDLNDSKASVTINGTTTVNTGAATPGLLVQAGALAMGALVLDAAHAGYGVQLSGGSASIGAVTNPSDSTAVQTSASSAVTINGALSNTGAGKILDSSNGAHSITSTSVTQGNAGAIIASIIDGTLVVALTCAPEGGKLIELLGGALTGAIDASAGASGCALVVQSGGTMNCSGDIHTGAGSSVAPLQRSAGAMTWTGDAEMGSGTTVPLVDESAASAGSTTLSGGTLSAADGVLTGFLKRATDGTSTISSTVTIGNLACMAHLPSGAGGTLVLSGIITENICSIRVYDESGDAVTVNYTPPDASATLSIIADNATRVFEIADYPGVGDVRDGTTFQHGEQEGTWSGGGAGGGIGAPTQIEQIFG